MGSFSEVPIDKPFFVHLNIFKDERGVGIYDIYGQIENGISEYFREKYMEQDIEQFRFNDFRQGQFNNTLTYPGIKRAWHNHFGQQDIMTVFPGNAIIAGFLDQGDQGFQTFRFVVGEMNPGAIIIPRGWMHGLTAIHGKPFVLHYYCNQKYNNGADEHRLAYTDFLKNPKYESLWDLLEVENK